MPPRALIIAAEEYPRANGALPTLPGTIAAAQAFENWLRQKWASEGETDTQLIFCSQPRQPNGVGGALEDILKAMVDLEAAGRGMTDQLYVYFSGHGFSFDDGANGRSDVLIAADFVDANISGHCCIKLDAIVWWLRLHMGVGQHFYFIDACRNDLDGNEIDPSLGPRRNPNTTGEPSTFLLQSTLSGALAAAGSRFPNALLEGLNGKGKAKVWQLPEKPNAMFVRHDSLFRHLKKTLPAQPPYSRVEGADGASEGIIATLSPAPLSRCNIEIKNGGAAMRATAAYSAGNNPPVQIPLVDASTTIQLPPDNYKISVTVPGAVVTPSEPVEADLYDDVSLVFECGDIPPRTRETRGTQAPPDAAPDTSGTLAVRLLRGTKLDLRNLETSQVRTIGASENVLLPQGPYLATVRDDSGSRFRPRALDISPGVLTDLDLTAWKRSAPHAAIALRLEDSDAGVDFAETLRDKPTEPDLDLWLALLGAGQILGSAGRHPKLTKFPMHRFDTEPPQASPVYVLAGFEKPSARLRVALSKNRNVDWIETTQPPNMSGIRHAYFKAEPGSHLLSLRLDDGSPYTIATMASPNRAMLVTVTLDPEGAFRIAQYLLPIEHLVPFLPPAVQAQLNRPNELREVRALARAHRAYRNRRDIAQAIDQNEYNELLYCKWLDPIASSLAAYELLRRSDRRHLGEVVENMAANFPDVPDGVALKILCGRAAERGKGVPLFFDGLRAFPEWKEWLPLPQSHLDFNSAWTAWLNAVKD